VRVERGKWDWVGVLILTVSIGMIIIALLTSIVSEERIEAPIAWCVAPVTKP
jgi:hypothetical protein